MSANTSAAQVATYELEIPIAAPRARVWRALTDETNGWWLPDFQMTGQGSTVRLEARAGGHLIEEHESGKSLLWYTVQMCTPGESIHLVGHVAPQWGGPAVTMLHISLEDKGDKTLLRLQDAQLGRISDSNLTSLKEGWTQLFRDGLKRHVED